MINCDCDIAIDSELLDRFASKQDAVAFEALVHRYAGVVYGSALRILGDPHAAEDIAQDCFMALARSPGAVDRSVVGWLHARATSRSLNRLRDEQRRRQREQKATAMNETPDHANTLVMWRQIQPLLDAAVAELPDDLREPVIMHYLEGKQQEAVAERMGVNQSTISRRLASALDRLHELLTARGVAVPVGVLGVLLVEKATVAAPVNLVTGLTASLATATATGAATGVSAATALGGGTTGVIAGTALGKMIAVALAFVGVGAVGITTYVVANKAPSENALSIETTSMEQAAVSEKDAPPANVRREGDRVWIDEVTYADTREVNGYVRGIAALLDARGEHVSYDRLMGLSGMAFITQVHAQRWKGVVDAGWWPLDGVGIQARKEFLSQAIGYEFCEYGGVWGVGDWDGIKPRLPQIYAEQMKAPLETAINAGQPAFAGWCGMNMAFLIYGYTTPGEGPPILGIGAGSTDGEIAQSSEWPYGVLILGERSAPLSEKAADIAALRYAVQLARDEVRLSEKYPWMSGEEGYAFWAELVRNPEEKIKNHHHGNVRRHLLINRTSAVRFLNEMSARYTDETADLLQEAARKYELVIESAQSLQPRGLSGSAEQRVAFADQIDAIAVIEQEAAELLAAAADSMSQ